MTKRRSKTPYEQKVEEEIKTIDRTRKMDKDLAKYGTPVRAGMMWTVADMQRYFHDTLGKKKRR